jgi:hypothetical protein
MSEKCCAVKPTPFIEFRRWLAALRSIDARGLVFNDLLKAVMSACGP